MVNPVIQTFSGKSVVIDRYGLTVIEAAWLEAGVLRTYATHPSLGFSISAAHAQRRRLALPPGEVNGKLQATLAGEKSIGLPFSGQSEVCTRRLVDERKFGVLYFTVAAPKILGHISRKK